jgi:hypothetical protein
LRGCNGRQCLTPPLCKRKASQTEGLAMENCRLYHLIVLLLLSLLAGVLLSTTSTTPPISIKPSCISPTVVLTPLKKMYARNEVIKIQLNITNTAHDAIRIADPNFLYGGELCLKVNPPLHIPDSRDLYVVNVCSEPIILKHDELYTKKLTIHFLIVF